MATRPSLHGAFAELQRRQEAELHQRQQAASILTPEQIGARTGISTARLLQTTLWAAGASFRLCSALVSVHCPDRAQHHGWRLRRRDASPRRGRVDAGLISHVPDERGLQAHAVGHGGCRGSGLVHTRILLTTAEAS